MGYNDLLYFEEQISLAVQQLRIPFIQRRMAADNNDPTEALADMMAEAQNLEKNLKQCVEIGSFMIDRNKELVDDNRRMADKIEQLQTDIESS